MHRAVVCAGTLFSIAACSGDQGGVSPENGTPGTQLAGAAGAGSQAPVTGAVLPGSAPASQTPALPVTPPVVPVSTTPPPVPQDTPVPGTAGPTTPVTPVMPATQAPPVPQGIAPPVGFTPNAMNECGLHTKWKGDEFCILPPPPDKGFQMHIGPTNYDNPDPMYILQPGQENVHRYTATGANDKDIMFYVRQYRMRPGAHHTIVRDSTNGRRLSGSDVNQDHPVGGITAPENAGIGIPLTAHVPLSVDHHAINSTDAPLLQEVWVNFWYVDPTKVTESTILLYDPGAVDINIPPHADVTLGPYACDIDKPGRLISMFGHIHANDVQFSAWRTRAGKKEPIYDSFRWEEPLWLEFTSLVKNTTANVPMHLDGGWTGILDLQAGDTLDWSCHEVNQQDTALRFTNQTYDGAMCIIIGDLVGSKCVSRNPSIVIDPSVE